MTTTAATELTPSELMAEDLAALFRARNPVIWVKTSEEMRVRKHIYGAAVAANFTVVHLWNCGEGVKTLKNKPETQFGPEGGPEPMLDALKDNKGERAIWILSDLTIWLKDPVTLRKLVNLALELPGKKSEDAQTVVIVSPTADIPPELANNITVIDWPLPNRVEIGKLLDAAIETVKDRLPNAAPNGVRDAAIDAAIGLSGSEAQASFASSFVRRGCVDPALIASEKKRAVASGGLIQWYDPLEGGLDAVGGLDELKAWLVSRRSAFSSKARAYGLSTPRGALLVGFSGCGKSLCAKAIGTAWSRPVLRIDLGALKSKFVGDSEANLRKALAQAETIGGIVWFDEIEKALQGSTSGSADGGVSADALGTVLSWMQERTGDAFVIATANDVSELPPELLRKGRFDKIWWVDLPTHAERVAITKAALAAAPFKRAADKIGIDLDKIAAATNEFTGAEIAAIVPEALNMSFGDEAWKAEHEGNPREVTTDDLLLAAKDIEPQFGEKNQAKGRDGKTQIERIRAARPAGARDATRKDTEDAAEDSTARQIDLD